MQSAKAHLESQEAQVAYSRIVSPISGIVADRPLNAGEMANPGSPLITRHGHFARGRAHQRSSGRSVHGESGPNRHHSLSPTAKKKSEGKVTVVSPAADPNTTTVQVWIQVPNPGERLKPGTAVHAAIATEVYKAATVVPVAAILPGEEGGTAVLTVSSDSIAHKRAVTLGVREGNQVQILSGANPGEEVVVVGGMGLDDKAKVKMVTTAVEESDDEDEATRRSPRRQGPERPPRRKIRRNRRKMSELSTAPPVDRRERSAALDRAPRQADHLRHPDAGGRGHLPGGIDSRRGFPEHRFPAHRGGRRRRRLSHRPDAGDRHPAFGRGRQHRTGPGSRDFDYQPGQRGNRPVLRLERRHVPDAATGERGAGAGPADACPRTPR